MHMYDCFIFALAEISCAMEHRPNQTTSVSWLDAKDPQRMSVAASCMFESLLVELPNKRGTNH